MEYPFKEYVISDDQQRIHVPTVIDFVTTSYWGNKRSPEKIKKSIQNSFCYGVYDEDKMIAFARLITDGATTYYLCDVFVLEDYRGQGFSKKLIEVITNSPDFEWMSGVLATKDAHGLYNQYGFEIENDRFMRRPAQGRQQ
ncbi:GNAT family N-acetyltransferase [Paenibacillus sp. GCM10012306]|uniref:GNAT family N-acetyltransferase n=1 Tax=Paenibacillus sp. GCM10012306 TaxID=3317342 RepID=UPI00360F9511